MMRPKISIISVVYNLLENKREDSFVRMIESVKAQAYGNIEHIIIDGDSNDGTKEFLKNLGLNFFSKKDSGIYDAMNNGIKKATGKYITFLNSDDFYFDENSIKKSILKLEVSQADFSFGNTKYIDENGNTVNGILQEIPDVKNIFLTMPCSHQSMIVKTDILKKFMFDTNFKIVSDFDFTLKLFLNHYKYVYVPEYIVNFQVGGVSSNIDNVHKETVKLYKNTLENIGIKLKNNEIIDIEYKKILPQKIAKILDKKFGVKVNKKLLPNKISFRKICFLGLPLFKVIKAQNFIDFYIFNIIKLFRLRWKIC